MEFPLKKVFSNPSQYMMSNILLFHIHTTQNVSMFAAFDIGRLTDLPDTSPGPREYLQDVFELSGSFQNETNRSLFIGSFQIFPHAEPAAAID